MFVTSFVYRYILNSNSSVIFCYSTKVSNFPCPFKKYGYVIVDGETQRHTLETLFVDKMFFFFNFTLHPACRRIGRENLDFVFVNEVMRINHPPIGNWTLASTVAWSIYLHYNNNTVRHGITSLLYIEMFQLQYNI